MTALAREAEAAALARDLRRLDRNRRQRAANIRLWYRLGNSLREVGLMAGLSGERVRQLLREMGEPTRGYGGARGRR